MHVPIVQGAGSFVGRFGRSPKVGREGEFLLGGVAHSVDVEPRL